jgi:CheY-like chemotaxis protein
LPKKPLILIVEDEYFLTADLEQVLNDAGFATEAVSSGEEALTLFMEDTRKHDALITDVRLQGILHGWDVARQLREKEPALPVIYVTGSNVEEWASHRVPNSILIPKPFTGRQLINAVSSLLNIESIPQSPMDAGDRVGKPMSN